MTRVIYPLLHDVDWLRTQVVENRLPYRQIAALAAVDGRVPSEATAWTAVTRAGLNRRQRRRRWDPSAEHLAEALVAHGSVSACALMDGVSASTWRSRARELGVVLGGRRKASGVGRLGDGLGAAEAVGVSSG